MEQSQTEKKPTELEKKKEEIKQLKAQITRLEMENEILKQFIGAWIYEPSW